MSAPDHASFLGTGWGFPPTFSRGAGGVGLTSDEEDIQSSLHILLTTRVGERIMQPRYGSDLRRLVFEPIDTALIANMKDLITTAILYFEPRIMLDDVIITSENDEGRVVVTLEYTIASTNTRNNFVYPFYVSEASRPPGTTTPDGST